jgi:hypothetical protein
LKTCVYLQHDLAMKLLQKLTTMIYQELGETTNAQIQFVCSHSGGVYARTKMTLTGRGIKLSSDGADSRDGKKAYHITAAAFAKIEKNYTTCFLASL